MVGAVVAYAGVDVACTVCAKANDSLRLVLSGLHVLSAIDIVFSAIAVF